MNRRKPMLGEAKGFFEMGKHEEGSNFEGDLVEYTKNLGFDDYSEHQHGSKCDSVRSRPRGGGGGGGDVIVEI